MYAHSVLVVVTNSIANRPSIKIEPLKSSKWEKNFKINSCFMVIGHYLVRSKVFNSNVYCNWNLN